MYAVPAHNVSAGILGSVPATEQQLQRQQSDFVPSQPGRRSRAMSWATQPGPRSAPPLQSRDNSPYRRPSLVGGSPSEGQSPSTVNKAPFDISEVALKLAAQHGDHSSDNLKLNDLFLDWKLDAQQRAIGARHLRNMPEDELEMLILRVPSQSSSTNTTGCPIPSSQ